MNHNRNIESTLGRKHIEIEPDFENNIQNSRYFGTIHPAIISPDTPHQRHIKGTSKAHIRRLSGVYPHFVFPDKPC